MLQLPGVQLMSEPILFVKPGCPKCDHVKARLPQGLSIRLLDVETPEGLAELAYRELVGLAEKALPILLEGSQDRAGAAVVYAGAIPVLRALTHPRATPETSTEENPTPTPTYQKETAMQQTTEVITAGDILHQGTQPATCAQGDPPAVPVEPPSCAPQEAHIQGKTCRKCGKTQTLAHFSTRRDAHDGHENTCRACRNKEKRARIAREQTAHTLNFSILDEVARFQERFRREYGDPAAFFKEAARFASLQMGKEVSAIDCARLLISLYQASEAHRPTHQRRVSLMAYIALLDQLQK